MIFNDYVYVVFSKSILKFYKIRAYYLEINSIDLFSVRNHQLHIRPQKHSYQKAKFLVTITYSIYWYRLTLIPA